MKQGLAVDFDGVIADTALAKKNWLLKNIGVVESKINLTRSYLLPKYGERVYFEMQSSVGFEDTLMCGQIKESINSIKGLSEFFDIHIISSRFPSKLGWINKWVANNGLSSFVVSINSSELELKANIAANLGCIALIDNDIRHVTFCFERQILFILFDEDDDSVHSISGPFLKANSWLAVRNCLNMHAD